MKKKIITFLLSLITITAINAQSAELSTLRIGAFKYQMTLREANSLSEKPLKTIKSDYGERKVATYKGDDIILEFNNYDENTVPGDIKLYSLSTKSSKFRTKSGLGVGSTKEELFTAYKNYPSFSVGRGWEKETGKPSATESYFTLDDFEAGTKLHFILKNNIVVEIEIYLDEGC